MVKSKRGPNEKADLATVEEILRSYGLEARRFTKAEIRGGKTPDFRLFKGNELVAYCEVKSPRDDWLSDQLDEAVPGEIVGDLRDDPVFNRIARMVEKAAQQFDAVNPDHEVPNVLLFVNHDRMSNYADLRETLTGAFLSADGSWHPTVKNVSEGSIKDAKYRIDAYAWFQRKQDRLQGWMLSEAAEHVDSVCVMFSIDRSKIVRPQ